MDTTAEAERVQAECLRRLGWEGRGRLAEQLMLSAIAVCEEGIQSRHPDYSPREVFLARARLILGDSLYRQAYRGEPLLAP